MKKPVYLVLFGLAAIHHHQTQALPQRHHRNRPAYSFQTFDHSTGFTGTSIPSIESSLPDISSQFAAQFSSASLPLPPSPEVQEQPTRQDNEVTSLPLYKQSFPGVYVKGHAAASLNKYEPTRQVAHHHGPDYQFSRNNIAALSSPVTGDSTGFGNNFVSSLFSGFNNS